MLQTFINLFIRPRSVGISQVIETTTFKSALGLYTVSWVLLRLVLGDIGVDVLQIAPIINDVEILSYFSTIVIFCIDYITILLRLIIAILLLWILYRFWCSVSLKKMIIISLYFMGLCFLFASIKLNLQSYFLSLDYLDDSNWSFLMECCGLVREYNYILYLLIAIFNPIPYDTNKQTHISSYHRNSIYPILYSGDYY